LVSAKKPSRANVGEYLTIKASILFGAALAAVMGVSGAATAGEIKLGMTTWVGYGEIFLAKD
jgi:NitT/TauT family transport system substrate-binding protein